MITVDSRQFSRAIQLVHSTISKRCTIPITSTVKVTANGALSLEGTDYDNHSRAEIPYDGSARSFCLQNAQGVRAAIIAAKGRQVYLTPVEKAVNIECGAFNSALSNCGYNTEDHPAGDRINEELFGVDLGTAELAQIARIMPAISTEETRYYLNGVAVFKVGEWLYRFVATDGHRLMISDVPLPGATGGLPDGTIIPRRWLAIAIASFAKTKEPVRLSYGFANNNHPDKTLDNTRGHRIAASGDLGGIRFTITGKLIDGTYPDYARVVPTENKHMLRMKRTDLVQAINSLTPMVTEKTRAVSIAFTAGGVSLDVISPDYGKSGFSVPAEHRETRDMVIGCNGQYLLDMCRALRGDEIEFHYNDGASPILIIDPSDTAFRGVQMPMRV